MFLRQSFLLLFLVPLCSSAFVRHSSDNDTSDFDCSPFCAKSRWGGGKLAAPSYPVQTPYRRERVPTVAAAVRNEAEKGVDLSMVLVIIVAMIGFSLAIRHLNDFFNGNTITLVKEGTWGHRFRHAEETHQPYQTRTDNSFLEMYDELSKNEERMRLRSGRPLEAGWEVNVDTD